MRTELQDRVAMYHAVNDITMRGEIVVFGSTFMADFPFYELSQKYVLNNALYNRSVKGLTLAEAEEVLDECVLEIRPSKIFLALGEADLDNPAAMMTYGRIIRKIKAKLPASRLYLLPIQENGNDKGRYAFNCELRALAERESVTFLDVPQGNFSIGSTYEKIFKKLNCFFRGNRVSFAEAFSYAD